MPEFESCSECAERWLDYARATKAHLALIKEQESVVDTDQFRELDALIEAAAIRRDKARLAVKVHMAQEHPGEKTRSNAAGG